MLLSIFLLILLFYVLPLFVLWLKVRRLEDHQDYTDTRLRQLAGDLRYYPPAPASSAPDAPPPAVPVVADVPDVPVVVPEPLMQAVPVVPDPVMAAPPVAAEPPALPHFPPPLPPLEMPVAPFATPDETPAVADPLPEPAALPVAAAAAVSAPGSWESMLGSNILNKAGALILVLGIALFLGYSFAHVGPAGRALMALAASTGILAAGFFVEKKQDYKVFAGGLLASGWASLYFTAYAIHALPAARIVESPALGMAAMLAVAAGMIGHSLRYRRQALTALAYTCAFAALALTELTSFAVFALVPLSLSMLVIAHRFQWFAMGVWSALVTYGLLYLKGSPDSTLLLSQSAVLVFWLLFEAYDYLRAGESDAMPRYALIGLNAAGALAISAGAWFTHKPDSMWLFCALWAGLYLASGIARALASPERRPEPAIVLSALLLALSIVAHVRGLWLSAALLLEAEVIFLAGHYLNQRWLRVLSWPAFLYALVSAFLETGRTQLGPLQFDDWALPVAMHAAVYAVNRFARPGSVYFSYAASSMTALLLATQAPWPLKGIALLASACALFEASLRRKLLEFRLQSYGFLLVGFGFALAGALDPSRSTVWGLAAACAATFAMTFRVARLPESTLGPDETGAIQIAASALASILLAVLPARVIGPSALAALGDTRLGVAWMAIAAVLAELSLRRLPRSFYLPAYPLALVGALQTLTSTWQLVDIKTHAASVPWDNLPLRCVLGVGVMSVYWFARFLRREEPEAPEIRLAAAFTGVLSAAIAAWAAAPNAFTAITWMALAVVFAEAGRLVRAQELSVLGHILALCAAGAFAFSNALAQTGHLREAAIVLAAGNIWLWWRAVSPSFAGLHLTIAPAPLGYLMYREMPEYYVAGWALLAAALSIAARFTGARALHYRALTVAAAAVAFAVLDTPPIAAVAGVAAALYLLFALTPREESPVLRLALSLTATSLCAFEILRDVDGGWQTIAWAVQGSLLIGAGFAVRERSFRLSGLTLFLICVLKVFIYDLPQLDAVYRILSFIGLGVLLLAASWIYARFDKQIKSLL